MPEQLAVLRRLAYSAERDGWSAAAFHSRVDNAGAAVGTLPLLVLRLKRAHVPVAKACDAPCRCCYHCRALWLSEAALHDCRLCYAAPSMTILSEVFIPVAGESHSPHQLHEQRLKLPTRLVCLQREPSCHLLSCEEVFVALQLPACCCCILDSTGVTGALSAAMTGVLGAGRGLGRTGIQGRTLQQCDYTLL